MKPDSPQLSRREREIMEVIHALREASATEIRERLTEPPANAAVRNCLLYTSPSPRDGLLSRMPSSA